MGKRFLLSGGLVCESFSVLIFRCQKGSTQLHTISKPNKDQIQAGVGTRFSWLWRARAHNRLGFLPACVSFSIFCYSDESSGPSVKTLSSTIIQMPFKGFCVALFCFFLCRIFFFGWGECYYVLLDCLLVFLIVPPPPNNHPRLYSSKNNSQHLSNHLSYWQVPLKGSNFQSWIAKCWQLMEETHRYLRKEKLLGLPNPCPIFPTQSSPTCTVS
jgi:hypothetical protein